MSENCPKCGYKKTNSIGTLISRKSFDCSVVYECYARDCQTIFVIAYDEKGKKEKVTILAKHPPTQAQIPQEARA